MRSNTSTTCDAIQSKLDDFCDAVLKPLESQAVEQHVQHCEACAEKLVSRQGLLAALQSVPRAKAPENLKAQILTAVELQDKNNKQASGKTNSGNTSSHNTNTGKTNNIIWFSAGFASALAASVLITVFVLLKPYASVAPDNLSVVAIANQVNQINFVVYAEKPRDDVRFTVRIPSNMQLKGYAGLQELTWNGKLLHGDNFLSLPVIALNTEPGVLVMQVQHKDATKEYKVNVTVQGQGRLS